MREVFSPEDFKLKEVIVLNGKVGYVSTGDEADETIGVLQNEKIKRLDGTFIDTPPTGFPLSKEMEARCGWSGNYASIQMLTGDTPIDVDHIDETKVVSMMGEVKSQYYHSYSSYTGYLGTTENFKCGGHDLLKILHSHMGEYIHIEIELYEKRFRKG